MCDDVRRAQAPVLGVFGVDDVQIPPELVRRFQEALETSRIEHEVISYHGVGHAFWRDMAQAALDIVLILFLFTFVSDGFSVAPCCEYVYGC